MLPVLPYLYCAFHKHVALHGPGSAVGEKGKKRCQIGKITAIAASRAVSWEGGTPPQTTSRLPLLVDFFLRQRRFFCPFSHNVEPGPRLIPTRILKFKSQLTFALFAAVNHLSGPLRKQKFTSTGSKGHGLLFVTGGFRSVLFVSVLQGSLLVIVVVIDGSEKRKCEGGFLNFKVPRVCACVIFMCYRVLFLKFARVALR